MIDDTAIAVIGLSGRFPGARDIGEYWANLRDGVCTIRDFEAGELRAAGVDDTEAGRADYVPSKGFLEDADRFEPELFGFTRAEAALLDPQHRLLLEASWGALEDAGYDPRRAPARTGVYAGGGVTEHMVAALADPRTAAEAGDTQVNILTGRDFLAPWVSYRLGLDGPSVTVQTACSTSLTAVHLAVQALLTGDCDAALAGGVYVDSIRKRGYRYQPGGILSPDGRCRPFDVRAAGTVPGNGVGVVVLRRLADAIADGDPIRAVILGTAVTNDGAAKVGFTAPGVERQTAAVTEAWAMADLDPGAAQYFEMHGTGTALGDPIELAAVTAAVGPAPADVEAVEAHGTGTPLRIGSVKSNIGHLDAAAGVAGLIKLVLMLGHGTYVPNAGSVEPFPELAPLSLIDKAEPWEQPAGGRRLAGISGLGIGGTNVHLVLTDAPLRHQPETPARIETLPLSARTEGQLRTLAGRLAAALQAPDAPALADAGHTLRTARTPLEVSAVVRAGTLAEAADSLAAIAAGGPVTRAAIPASQDQAAGSRRVHLPTYPFAGDKYGALSLGGPPAAEPAPAAAALTEATVLALVTTSLGATGQIEADTSYIGAGADSLDAIHLAGRLREDLGVDVPIELLLQPLPLPELAARIVALAEDDALSGLLDEAEA